MLAANKRQRRHCHLPTPITPQSVFFFNAAMSYRYQKC